MSAKKKETKAKDSNQLKVKDQFIVTDHFGDLLEISITKLSPSNEYVKIIAERPDDVHRALRWIKVDELWTTYRFVEKLNK